MGISVLLMKKVFIDEQFYPLRKVRKYHYYNLDKREAINC